MTSNQINAMASALSHYNERGERERWPVLVYRLKSKGWEVYADPDMEAAASSTAAPGSSKKNGSTPAQAKRPPVEELTAAPRTGCIEVRKMRLRIRLFEQNKPWNPNQLRPRQAGESQDRRGSNDEDGGDGENNEKSGGGVGHSQSAENEDYDSDIPGSDGWNNNALVVRRQNTLLISTRRGMGAIVFQFKSDLECIEFCDRLVYLNQDYFNKPIYDSQSGADGGLGKRPLEGRGQVVNGMTQNELYCNQLREYKRRRYAMLGDEATGNVSYNDMALQSEENVNGLVNSAPVDETRKYRRNEELLSYIVRLAHDEDFRGFVDELERGLESAPDCSGVHAALGGL